MYANIMAFIKIEEIPINWCNTRKEYQKTNYYKSIKIKQSTY